MAILTGTLWILVVGVILCQAVDLPVLQQTEGSQDVPPSQGVLKCRLVDNYPGEVTFTWYKDGQPLETKNNENYKLVNGDLHLKGKSEDGKYQCQAKTELGVASTRVIDVKEERLEYPPTTKTTHKPTEGKPFKLECPIGNVYPKPIIEWTKQKNSDPTKFLDRRITMSPDGTLWFSNVTQDDAGYKFVCRAKQSEKSEGVEIAEHVIESVVENHEVNGELEPQYLSQDFTAKVNDVTMIYCIYGGTPLAHPGWEKDGKNVNGEPHDRVTRYNRSSGRRLLIKQTLLEDQGRYKCLVNNGVGKPSSHDLFLTVVEPPKYVQKPVQKLQVKEGEDIKLPCSVSGTPAPKLTLTYNAKPLTLDDRITSTASTDERTSRADVTIAKARKSDTGYYGCGADNGHGSDYAETLVYVA